MRRALSIGTLCAVLLLLTQGSSQAASPATGSNPLAEIPIVLHQQAADWNRGDLQAFAAGYKNSPDILFLGRSIAHGYAGTLASYKKNYPDRASMGTLSFTHLEVQPLDARFATTTGSFHLARTPQGGGNLDGHFLLVLERTSAGWKIIRDDTTPDPATK
jgi:Domain of unknown function (DUF4440)